MSIRIVRREDAKTDSFSGAEWCVGDRGGEYDRGEELKQGDEETKDTQVL